MVPMLERHLESLSMQPSKNLGAVIMTIEYFDYDYDSCVLGPCKESPIKVSVVTLNLYAFLAI